MARPKNPDKKKAESIYFDPDLVEWLKVESDKEERTVSFLVNKIVREKMEQEESK